MRERDKEKKKKKKKRKKDDDVEGDALSDHEDSVSKDKEREREKKEKDKPSSVEKKRVFAKVRKKDEDKECEKNGAAMECTEEANQGSPSRFASLNLNFKIIEKTSAGGSPRSPRVLPFSMSPRSPFRADRDRERERDKDRDTISHPNSPRFYAFHGPNSPRALRHERVPMSHMKVEKERDQKEICKPLSPQLSKKNKAQV